MIAVNTQYVDFFTTKSQKTISKGFEGTFGIKSALENLGISENDEIIVAIPFENDLSFTASGIISKVNSITKIKNENLKGGSEVPTPREKYSHNFEVTITKDLTKNNLLSDLEYSMKCVYRFNKPKVHFQQQYRELPKDDYDTIVKGWIYTTRTAFGKLINAIPRQNKLEFMLQAMDRFATVNFVDVSLYEGLHFLNDYINRRILSRGRVLIATNNLIKNELKDIVPDNEIGFYNDKKGLADTLATQASLFENLFSLEGRADIQKIINASISEDSNLEQRFLQIFKSQTWPIDLSI